MLHLTGNVNRTWNLQRTKNLQVTIVPSIKSQCLWAEQCNFAGELGTSEYRGVTGPAAPEGMVQTAPGKETEPPGACSLPGRAVWHTS